MDNLAISEPFNANNSVINRLFGTSQSSRAASEVSLRHGRVLLWSHANLQVDHAAAFISTSNAHSPVCECRICACREWRAGSFALSCGSSALSPETADPQQVRACPAEVRRGRRWPCSREWRKLEEKRNENVRPRHQNNPRLYVQYNDSLRGQQNKGWLSPPAAPQCCVTH